MTQPISQGLTPNQDAAAKRAAHGIDAPDAFLDIPNAIGGKPDIKSEYWDCLFRAVKRRLRLMADEGSGMYQTTQRPEKLARTTVGILECCDALDQLHVSLGQERLHCEALKAELASAKTSLADARNEIAKAQEGEIHARRRALHDDLTALPNRSFFRSRLDDALDQTGQSRHMLAVLYLDLDAFKPVNDVHGHNTGDELLRVVAERLTRAIRSEDMVSRVGGDEFACLLAGKQSRKDLGELARNLFDVVSEPLNVGEIKIAVRPSIGIAIAPSDGATAEALLKSADEAMYMAKRRHSGYAFFSDCRST